ncbi:MAG TPA: hypothetical protein VEN81_03530, partial [Planctomycetota bacterium]|nr:hypothetical protein [Planctomycetota bacterium]
VEFLQSFVASPRLKGVVDERAAIQSSLEQLKKDAFESLPVDRAVMTDGRILNGRIAEEGPETVRFERKLGRGVGGTMNLKRSEIKELQKGRGLGGEFRSRWDQAQKGAPVADLVGLLNWCHENSLVAQAQMTAFLILATEPGHPVARTEAGLAANPVQAAIELAAQGGGIPYQGRTWLPKELREKLQKEGFALFGGAWYARKERIIAVPSLFRYENQAEKPVQILGASAPLNHDTEILWRAVQEPGSTLAHSASEVKYLRRFYAPTIAVSSFTTTTNGGVKALETHTDRAESPVGKDLTGEVFISVPLGVPVFEGSVMTTAETKQGGTVTVYQINGGERVRLYACKAKEEESHPLAESIRGQTKVDLVAVITLQPAYIPKTERKEISPPRMDQKLRTVLQKGLDLQVDRQIPDYRAVLFPSQPQNTYDVFRLKVVVGEPAPVLDRLFSDSGHADLLR